MKFFIINFLFLITIFSKSQFAQTNNFEILYTGFNGKITAFSEDTNGNIWAAVWSHSNNDSTNEVVLINEQIIDTIFIHSTFPIFSIDVDIYNNLWIATQDTGLVKYSDSDLTYIDVSEIITLRDRNNVNCVQFDNENNLWIGAQNGIAKYDGNSWTVYDETNTQLQTFPDIWSMKFDSSNVLWFGHYYGVGRLNNNAWSFWSSPDFEYATTVEINKNGSIWVATESGSLVNLTSDTTWTIYQFPAIPSWNYQLTIDTNGIVWFGKFDPVENVVAFDGSTFNVLNIPYTEIQNATLSAVFSDRSNNKWFGFDNGYIVKYSGDFPTRLADDDAVLKNFKLGQNYPNPFNPSTKISWQSPVGSWQTLKMFDVLGNEVATLVDEYRNAGSHELEFKSTVGSRQLTSGIYFYKLQAGSFAETKKMILIK